MAGKTAWYGLGLHVYAGEDLPETAQTRQKADEDSKTNKLKDKYREGTGKTDGFEAWVEKMQGKGMSFEQMDYLLQEALNKKAEERKRSSITQVSTPKSNKVSKVS